MKRLIYTLLAFIGSTTFAAHAEKFQVGSLWYETLSDNTVQTAAGKAELKIVKEMGNNPEHNNAWEEMEVTKMVVEAPNKFNNWEPGEIPSHVTYNNRTYEVVKIGDYSFYGQLFTNVLIIPETVREIGKGAFGDWFNRGGTFDLDLKNVEIIGDSAFYMNSSVKSLNLNGNTRVIGKSAFERCEGLGTYNPSGIDLSGVETVSENAFRGTNLKGVTFDDAILEIGDYAFYDPNSNMTKVVFGNRLKHIGNHAFNSAFNIPEIIIPDSVETIGDYAFYNCDKACPLVIGKNVRSIGTYAFYYGRTMCNHVLELPASLEYIGPNAFAFNYTSSGSRDNGLTDINIHAITPPDMPWIDGFSGFGEWDPAKGDAWGSMYYWMYPFICLHVPKGSLEAYQKHPEWSKFQCMIDDLVPEETMSNGPEGSLQNFVGYVFMSIPPNVDEHETFTLTNALLNDPSIKIDRWEMVTDKGVITLDPATGFISAQQFGQQLVLAYDEHYTHRWNGNEWEDVEGVVGAVMVFVCPTITLVYGNTDESPMALSTKAVGSGSDFEYSSIVDANASYQHLSVHNSYPKFEITAPVGIEFSLMEKAHFDEDGHATNDYSEFIEIKDDQFVGSGSETQGNYLVPNSSITENRVVKVSYNLTEDNGIHTSVSEINIDEAGIRISADGHRVTITGAEPGDIVKVYDMSGALKLSTTDKSFTIPATGVYVISINGYNVKAIVR